MRILLILLFTTLAFGCFDNKSKQGTNFILPGDATRERIIKNEIYAGMNIFDNHWPVEFMISTADFETTINALNTISECTLITEFADHTVSPAGVHRWKAKMRLFNDTVEVSKMTYFDWEHPMFSFKWTETFDQVKSGSKIKEIELALYRNEINYNLADYLKD